MHTCVRRMNARTRPNTRPTSDSTRIDSTRPPPWCTMHHCITNDRGAIGWRPLANNQALIKRKRKRTHPEISIIPALRPQAPPAFRAASPEIEGVTPLGVTARSIIIGALSEPASCALRRARSRSLTGSPRGGGRSRECARATRTRTRTGTRRSRSMASCKFIAVGRYRCTR